MTGRRKPVFLDEDLDVVYDEPLATMRKMRGRGSVSECDACELETRKDD